MKRIIVFLLILGGLIPVLLCRGQGEVQERMVPSRTDDRGRNILIAYFTLGHNTAYPDDVDATSSASLVLDNTALVGTTEYVARLVQAETGGDLYSIETVEPYPSDFEAVVARNHNEMRNPELKDSALNLSQYDTIFIGYPVWATTVPRAILSFIDKYDLSGKTIIPFCTHGGYGAGRSYRAIASAIDGEITMLDGLAIEADDVSDSAIVVARWLDEIGIERSTSEETSITITVGDTILDGILYNTELAMEISAYFPLTISMRSFGDREYYGGVDFYPENIESGQTSFDNGDITYCEAHHNMAIFYAQTDNPVLSVAVVPIGKVTSDLSVFKDFDDLEEVTFSFADQL